MFATANPSGGGFDLVGRCPAIVSASFLRVSIPEIRTTLEADRSKLNNHEYT
jgi:hypothetical protein